MVENDDEEICDAMNQSTLTNALRAPLTLLGLKIGYGGVH